jgi:hypothetical protein
MPRLALSAACCAALAAAAFFAGRAVSDEPPAAPPNMEELMKEMERLKTPGPQHQLLQGMCGAWLGKGTWTEQGMSSSFTEEFTAKMVFGGRFLAVESKMTTEASDQMPSMTMSSQMFVGYDNAKQKYVQAMLGDWSTSLGTSEGVFDAASKTLTMSGVEVLGPGKERTYRMVQTFTSADAWRFEMYFTQPDGKEAKVGEAVYTRQ